MTTTVIVKAHCASDKEVVIERTHSGELDAQFTLQDGEEHSLVVHGDLAVSVREVLKD